MSSKPQQLMIKSYFLNDLITTTLVLAWCATSATMVCTVMDTSSVAEHAATGCRPGLVALAALVIIQGCLQPCSELPTHLASSGALVHLVNSVQYVFSLSTYNLYLCTDYLL